MKFLLFTLILSPLLALEVVKDISELTFKTPSMAQIETRKLRLDNGLEAILISDPSVEESGITVAVETGSWQDPKEASGMAHFTEHMLFLGSATYPDQNGFRQFLAAHNGKANAFTADQFTCYMFTIETDHFGEALGPFSHFFIDPLFSASSMVCERPNVDQEFRRAIENDNWRQHMVEKGIANPRHPHSDFGFGSHETLGSLRPEQMRAWFESHYSSKIMHLVVYSSLSLDALQEMVETHFSQVPDRGVGPFPVSGPKLAPENSGKLLAIKPHKELRQLTLAWELPYNDANERECGAARCASYLLGHEGEGSLASRLRQQGLIEGMAAEVDVYRKPHSPTCTLLIAMDLTEKGLREREQVIAELFGAINGYKQQQLPDYLFEEMQVIRRLQYEYSTRGDLFSQMRDYAFHLAEEPLATYPQELVLAKRFDPAATQQLFRKLKPQTAQYTLVAHPKEIGVRMSHREKFIGGQYTMIPFAKEQLDSWDDSPPQSTLPSPNPYVPKQLTLTQTPGLAEPQLLSDNDYGKIYYADDTAFSVPEIAWTMIIKSPAAVPGDPKATALRSLLLASIQHAMAEERHAAKLGKLRYTLAPAEEGIQLSIRGLKDKAPILFTTLLQTLKGIDPTSTDFETVKGALARKLGNASKDTPAAQALELFRSLLIKNFVTSSEQVTALKGLTLQDLLQFRDSFIETTYVQGMLFGNFTPSEAQQIAKDIRQFQTHPYPEGKIRKAQIATFTDEAPFLVTKKSLSLGTAAILTIQETPYTLENRSLQQILGAALEEPFFSELRTKQQTGYVAWSWDSDLERHLFQSFLVQSNTHDTRDLIARYETFIEDFLRNLKTGAFTKEHFEALKNSLISKLKRAPKNPRDAAAQLFVFAFDYEDFDWIAKRIQATKPLTYEQFITEAEEWLGRENKRRLGVLLRGKLPEEAIQYKTLNSPQKWKTLTSYQGRTHSPGETPW